MATPERSERYAAALIALYVLAEERLLAEATKILRAAPATNAGAFTVLGLARQMVRRVLASLGRSDALTTAMVTAAASEGRRDADAAVAASRALVRAGVSPAGRGGSRGPGDGRPPGSARVRPGDEPFDLSMPHGERAAQAIRDDVVSSLEDVRFRITRLPDDIYKMIAPHGAIYQVIDQGVSPAQAQAMAWRVFVSEGVTGFTDKSGRNWSLSAYVEMAVRTASARAYNASHLARMRALGVEYFTIPPTGHPCPLCFPWQGKVLTVGQIPNPRIRVDATIAEATLAGLFHPNAILGNQAVQALGSVENGVKAWYSGPSINVTTASGVRITVSPNHPVLTATGWLPAKFLHEGMQIFRTPDRGLNDSTSTNEDLDDGVPRIQQVLDALAATGGRTAVPATADDLHGDGRFVQGEIDVVVADRDLVAVIDAHRAKVLGDDVLPRSDVQTTLCASHRAESLRLLGVERAVAGSLPDFDASTLYAPSDRRAADAETVGEILAGLPVEVSADQIVGVEIDWYEGHAFDLQTATGAYVASSILVHNCRHPLLPVFPGVTVLPDPVEWTPELDAEYKASQRQRHLELQVRKAKRQLEYAATPEARQEATVRVRRAQAKVREFIRNTGFLRDSRREQVDLTDAYVKLPTPIR